MLVYRGYITVKDLKLIVLPDTPFEPGQRIEVLAIAENERSAARRCELVALLKATQALP
jgi:hypothetical protein